MSSDPLTDPYDEIVAAASTPRRRRANTDYDEDSALDLIAQHESGGRNIKQNVVPPGGGFNPSVGRVTGPSSASGPWQITNTTWRKRAPREIAQKYPTAMSAPVEVQRSVAGKIFRETGFQDWAPYNASLRKAISRGERAKQPQQPQEDPYDDIVKAASGERAQASDPYDAIVSAASPEFTPQRGRVDPSPQPTRFPRGVTKGTATSRLIGQRGQVEASGLGPSAPRTIGMGDVKAVERVELPRRERIQQQVAQEQAAGRQALQQQPTSAAGRLYDPRLNQEEEVLNRITGEREREAEIAKLEAKRPEIDALKQKFREFGGLGHRGRLTQSLQGALANTGVQSGNLISLLEKGTWGGGESGKELTEQMRLAQVALGELEAEDPDKGYLAAAERALPGAMFELAKMVSLSKVPVAGRATLPGLGALSEADKGIGPAVEGAVKGEAYHRGFGAMGNLPKPVQFAAGTAVPTTIDVSQGADWKQSLLSNTAFGAMALATPKRGVRSARPEAVAQAPEAPDQQPRYFQIDKSGREVEIFPNEGVKPSETKVETQPNNIAEIGSARRVEPSAGTFRQNEAANAVSDVSRTGTNISEMGRGSVATPPRHYELQPRRQRGEGKGRFKPESRAEKETRRQQVASRPEAGVEQWYNALRDTNEFSHLADLDPVVDAVRAKKITPQQAIETFKAMAAEREIPPEKLPLTHASLQPRRVRGEGKGQFKPETKAQREQRLATLESPELYALRSRALAEGRTEDVDALNAEMKRRYFASKTPTERPNPPLTNPPRETAGVQPIAEGATTSASTPSPAREPWQQTQNDWLSRINPANQRIDAKARPTVYAEDMEGMFEGGKIIKRTPLKDERMLVIRETPDGEIYGEVNGKTVGYATPLSQVELDVTVDPVYQRQGIGARLQQEFYRLNPDFQSGGVTDAGEQSSRATHKLFVEEALREGKPVPPEVLADYPDLQAKVPTPKTTEGVSTPEAVSTVADIIAPSTTSARKEPEIKTSKLALGVEAKAIEAKLTEGFRDLPEYETVKVANQAEKAAKLLKSDPVRATRIAMGKELPPADLLPESVFVAVENQAMKMSNVNVLRDLATASTLPSEATGMGQRIRLLAERNPFSAVSAIRDVQLAREAKAQRTHGDVKKAREKIKSEVKVELKKSAPKAEAWQSFLETIKC